LRRSSRFPTWSITYVLRRLEGDLSELDKQAAASIGDWVLVGGGSFSSDTASIANDTTVELSADSEVNASSSDVEGSPVAARSGAERMGLAVLAAMVAVASHGVAL